jgi:hypothetical protein
VHNVRIERLWVDVTAQVGASWAELFTDLEVYCGLDINNPNHIWLLHELFLPTINNQLALFAEAWNRHRIQIRNGPNRSPADMFGFDMLVHGVRGYQLHEDTLTTNEEVEVYGVDWEALQDEHLLLSRQQNNTQEEGAASWIGRVGPPDNLNEVALEAPQVQLAPTAVELVENHIQGIEETDPLQAWANALAYMQSVYGNSF